LPEAGGDPGATRSTSENGPAAALPEQLPADFGRYRLLRLLGKGGMGAVYLAHDSQLDRPVALKIPLFGPADDPSLRERFFTEARAAATLFHANICPVYDVGVHDGLH
jgi:serine/threonine protein kinase